MDDPLFTRKPIVAKLVLDIFRTFSEEVFSTPKICRYSDELLLTCGIYVGQHEGRPMTAAKLANYMGMPRPTVVRKVRALEQAGIVSITGQRRHIIMSAHRRADGGAETLRRMDSMVLQAARELLSKMDTKRIDRRR